MRLAQPPVFNVVQHLHAVFATNGKELLSDAKLLPTLMLRVGLALRARMRPDEAHCSLFRDQERLRCEVKMFISADLLRLSTRHGGGGTAPDVVAVGMCTTHSWAVALPDAEQTSHDVNNFT